MATPGQRISIDIGLGSKFRADIRAAGKHSATLDLGLDPFLRIATAFLVESAFARRKVRRRYEDLEVVLRLSFDKHAVIAGLKDPNIAHRLRKADVRVHRVEWRHGRILVDVEKVGVGRGFFEATVEVDEVARLLVFHLGENNLPGGVWPVSISQAYTCVRVRGSRMELDLRPMSAIRFRFSGTTASLTMVMRLGQLLDFIHAHE